MLYDLHAHRRKGLDHHVGFPAASVTATPSPTITKTPRPESRGKTLIVACVSTNLRGRR
jgi:hypothetical protein